MEAEAQERAHAMMQRQSSSILESLGNSASQLANQLTSSIEDKPYIAPI